MEHLPLRSWSRAQRQCLETAVDELTRAWRRDWGLASDAASDAARCTMASDDAAGAGVDWQLAPHAAARCQLWWDCALSPGDTVDDLLVAALFDANHVTAGAELAAGVARAAWADLWQRACDRLTPDPTAATGLAQHCFRPWSGAVVIALPWCGRQLRMLLSGAAAERFLGAARAGADIKTPRAAAVPPGPLWEALAPVQCTLHVELEPVELTLGAVNSLRIGDIVELRHPLEAPLLARAGEGLLCEAWLGKVAGQRGIELTRAPARAH